MKYSYNLSLDILENYLRALDARNLKSTLTSASLYQLSVMAALDSLPKFFVLALYLSSLSGLRLSWRLYKSPSLPF